MLNLFMPIQVAWFCQQREVTIVESCSGFGLWLQARPSVAEGEAFLRRPVETTKDPVFCRHMGSPAKESSVLLAMASHFTSPSVSVLLPTEQACEHKQDALPCPALPSFPREQASEGDGTSQE